MCRTCDSHGFVTLKGHAFTTTTRVVVVHSWSLQGLINHEWGASFADMRLGFHRVKTPQKSQTPHSVLRTKPCGLGSPKRTNSLRAVEQNPPPQFFICFIFFKEENWARTITFFFHSQDPEASHSHKSYEMGIASFWLKYW